MFMIVNSVKSVDFIITENRIFGEDHSFGCENVKMSVRSEVLDNQGAVCVCGEAVQ